MYYLIYADENVYQGLHGMYDWTITQCDTEEEANEIAMSMSIDVMESYNEIMDDLYEEAGITLTDDTELSDEDLNRLDEVMQNNIDFIITPIPDDFFPLIVDDDDYGVICNKLDEYNLSH